MDTSIFLWTRNNENIKKSSPFFTFLMFKNMKKKNRIQNDISYTPGKLGMSPIRRAHVNHSYIDFYQSMCNRQDVKWFSANGHLSNISPRISLIVNIYNFLNNGAVWSLYLLNVIIRIALF